MINLSLRCFDDAPSTDGSTHSVALDYTNVMSIAEFTYDGGCGTRVILKDGQVFLCTDEFMAVMMDINDKSRHYAYEDKMFEIYKHTLATLAPKMFSSEYKGKEAEVAVDKITKFAELVASNWDEYRREVM
jgi:hypothetical protein